MNLSLILCATFDLVLLTPPLRAVAKLMRSSSVLVDDVSLERRTDDVSPLEVVQGQHAQKIQILESNLAALQAKYDAEISSLKSQIAAMSVPLVFTAEHQIDRSYTPGSVIRFDRVITNVGNMYDAVTGIVTVPQDGVYSIYVRSDPPYGLNNSEDLELMVNNVHIMNAVAEQGTLGGLVAALKLSKGDKVYAIKRQGGGFASEVGSASVFSVVRVSP